MERGDCVEEGGGSLIRPSSSAPSVGPSRLKLVLSVNESMRSS